MSQGDVLLYAVLPYAAIAVFVVGHVWRYRSDQYGWGARSTQLLESRVLKYSSIVFHLGVLAAIGGHVLGLLVPRGWTAAVGINDEAYHVIAVIGGLAAGGAVIVWPLSQRLWLPGATANASLVCTSWPAAASLRISPSANGSRDVVIRIRTRRNLRHRSSYHSLSRADSSRTPELTCQRSTTALSRSGLRRTIPLPWSSSGTRTRIACSPRH